jgi:putative ABC transport system permease protein
MTSLFQDVRHGVRGLRRAPGFTAAAVAVLALGIGASVSLFSVLHAVLLRPLPYAAPERLVVVQQTREAEKGGVSWPHLQDWRAQSRSFESLAAWAPQGFTLGGAEGATRVEGVVASADLLPLLGAQPQLGRTFRPEEERRGGGEVRPVVVSHAFWRTHLGGSPAALGGTVALDGVDYTVVGVLPEAFRFPPGAPQPAEVYLSVAVDAEPDVYGGTIPTSRGYMRYTAALGRLKAGVTLQQAREELGRVASALVAAHPGTTQYTGVAVTAAHEHLVGATRPVLLLLLAAVGCLLLVGCVNVANLLLARATVRRREVAVRLALGASRGRVAWQLLVESLLLALAGGAAGLLLAVWGVDALLALAPPGVPRLDEVRVDGVVLGFTLGVSLLTALLAGLLPAWSASGAHLAEALKDAGRAATEGKRGGQLRGALVAGQTAVALVLLVGAGLLGQSLVRLSRESPGFVTQGLLAAQVELPVSRYPQGSPAVSAFWAALTERVRALPGVTAASTAQSLPLSGEGNGTSLEVEGVPGGGRGVGLRFVGLDYFRTLGQGQVAGRDFTAADGPGAPPVALVNEAFVRAFLEGRPPLGQRVKLGWGGKGLREVVGVVRDVRHGGPGALPEPEVYVPQAQFPLNTLSLVVRTRGAPELLVPALREEVRALDAGLPLSEVRTVEGLRATALLPQRFVTLLLGLFAGLTLLLTVLGLGGVVAYTVAQRTHEFGVRAALGAQARDVLGLVLWQGLRRAALGVAVGLVAAYGLTGLLARWLYGVGPTDGWTFLAAAGVLVAAALLACWLPARRATRVSPLTALRAE